MNKVNRNSITSLIELLFLFITIIAGLINTEYFYTASYAAYYLFIFSAILYILVITITPPHLYLTNHKRFTFQKPILFLGLWCVYVVVHYFSHSASTLFTIYILVHFLFLQSTTKIFSQPDFSFIRLSYGIVIIATIQSLYCLGQCLTIFKSQNDLFTVTGSWVNPNVIAQFLAITVPFFLYLFQFQFKKIILSCLGIVLIALLLLKCRTAYIATIVIVLIYYVLEYDFICWIKNPKNIKSVRALFVVLLIVVIPIATHLYNAKKASADGRLLIWKLSAMMVIEKPLTGYGYGSFAKEYNLFQADFLGKGKATLEEQTTAGPTIMAHNEVLQNAVDGGIMGLLLFLLFFGSLIFSIQQIRKDDIHFTVNTDKLPTKNSIFHFAYAGVVGFLTMSMFNFAVQAVPIMTILILYAAIISSQLIPISKKAKFSFLYSKWVTIVTKITICCCCCYLLFVILNIALADTLNKKASNLKKEGHLKEALQTMPKLEYWLKEESNYWKNYGNIHFLKKDFLAALKCLDRAKETSSSPDLYLGSGACYEKQKLYPQAIHQYTQLVLLHPSKFKYRFQLLTAYVQTKDTANIVLVAQGIIDLKPKIPSSEVVRYKKIAQRIRMTFDKKYKKSATTKNFLQSNQPKIYF